MQCILEEKTFQESTKNISFHLGPPTLVAESDSQILIMYLGCTYSVQFSINAFNYKELYLFLMEICDWLTEIQKISLPTQCCFRSTVKTISVIILIKKNAALWAIHVISNPPRELASAKTKLGGTSNPCTTLLSNSWFWELVELFPEAAFAHVISWDLSALKITKHIDQILKTTSVSEMIFCSLTCGIIHKPDFMSLF